MLLCRVYAYMCILLCSLVIVLVGSDSASGAQGHAVKVSHGVPARVAADITKANGQQSVTTDKPLQLRIPAIHVSSAIEPVGVLASGDLATPQQQPWTNVGWYTAGPRPGEYGSAVIDGHLDRPGGLPAVFWNLSSLQRGDEIIVAMTSGKILHFAVTRVEYYVPQQAPLEAIFGDSGGHYLNLITCAGDWIPAQHQTTQRLVVFATLK